MPKYQPPSGEPDVSTFRTLTDDQRKMEWRRRKHIEKMDLVPTRMSKMLGWAGWGSAIFVVGWMSLYEDFGDQPNVFTDLRKHYRQFMKSTFNLSPQERNLLGMKREPQPVDSEDIIKRLDPARAATGSSMGVSNARDPAINDGKPS